MPYLCPYWSSIGLLGRRRPTAPRSCKVGHAVRSLLLARRGLAALEFAFIAPAAVALAFGVYDLTNAFMAIRKVTQATQSIGEIATALVANTDNTNSLTLNQGNAASSALFAYLPALRGGASDSLFGVALSSVVFKPVATNCTGIGCQFTATTAWSTNFRGNVAVARPCSSDPTKPSLTSAPDNASSYASNELPAGAFSAAPMLVVDVAYTLKPTTMQLIKQNIVIHRSAYLPLRTGTNDRWVRYVDPPNPKVRCPGYEQ